VPKGHTRRAIRAAGAADRNRLLWRKFVAIFSASLLFIAVASVSGRAGASQSAQLVYSRSPLARACPDEDGLRQSVARRLGYDPFVAVSSSTLVAELFGDGVQLRARVFLVQDGNVTGGTRELSSRAANCDELIAAVALAISIAIDPDAIESDGDHTNDAATPDDSLPKAPATPAEGAQAEAAPSSPVIQRPLAESQASLPKLASPADRLRWALGAGGFVASGPEPAPSFGTALLVTLRSNHWSLGIEPRWAAASSTKNLDGAAGSASMAAYGASLAPCYRSGGFLACYTLEAALLFSAGRGLAHPSTDRSWWAAQGPRLGYRWGRTGGLGITLRLDALVAVERITLRLDGRDAFETPLACLRLGLDADYEL